MTEHQEWQHISNCIKAAFQRLKMLRLNAKHKTNQEKAEQVERAILDTLQKQYDNERKIRN